MATAAADGARTRFAGTVAARKAALAAIVAHRRAESVGYDVAVLTDPKGRSLVLLGETHLKDAHSQSLGVALLEHYPLRAIEYAPPGYWGLPLARACRAGVQAAANFFGRARLRDSTIFDAVSLTVKEHLASGEQGVASALHALTSGFHLGELSAKQRRRMSIRMPKWPHDRQTVPAFAEAVRAQGLARELRSMDDIWEATQQLPDQTPNEPLGQPAIEWLEWNHQPNAKEQIAVVLGTLAPLKLVALAGPTLYPLASYLSLVPFSRPAFGIMAAFAAATTVGHLVGEYLPRDQWGTWRSALLGDGKALIPRRDQTMVQNLANLFERNPGHERAAAVVGVGHFPGQIAGLEAKGWTCDLRVLSASEAATPN